MNECVIFMSAYNPTHYKTANWFSRNFHRIRSSRDKDRLQSLLKKYHLTYLANDDRIISVDKKLDLNIKYDYIHQSTTFDFPMEKSEQKGNIDSIDDIGIFSTPDML